jgi:CRP-like cAMP-binding protein
LATLERTLHRRRYPAGVPIIAEEQPGDVVYVILEGSVRVFVDQPDGNQVILAILAAGEIVGEMSVVDSLVRSANVVTQEPSVLAWTDRTTFWECLRTIPRLTYNLAQILSRRIRLANAQIEALATLTVHGRVARQILAFAQEYGRPGDGGSLVIPIRLTQNDLAGLVGASRVRVNQVLVGYRRRRYISVDRGHHIIVHNPTALAERCQ